VPVGPWNTDGLIFLTPVLTEQRIQYVRRLADSGFPLLYVGGHADFPAITIDNEGGIRQAMEHLVEHGHRSIAFIAGDEKDTGDSYARVNAYRQCIRDFGLNEDPRLLAYGYHWAVGGRHAMQQILQSGVDFTAVMCSNDLSAIGASQALREAGRKIPGDAAIIGYDDILESLAEIPPLTSVHFPLFETGYRALLLLQKRIEQGAKALPDLTRVSTWLVQRQSCGCLPDVVSNSVFSGEPVLPAADPFSAEFRDGLAQAMLDELLSQNPLSQSKDFLPLCEILADGFLQSLKDGKFVHFQSSLTNVLQQVEMMSDDNTQAWQSAITVLRRAAYAVLISGGGPENDRRVEDLLHQARTLISESVERRYTRLKVHRTGLDERIGILTARLISSSDEDQVYTVLLEDLPQIDVRLCNVVFFEEQGRDPTARSALKPLQKDAPVVRFETRKFPPPGVYPDGEPFSLALLPLTYQDEKLGYVAFDGGNLDPLATLARQLASSIKNAQLHAKVLELSLTDALTGVHNRRYFEILLQKETERNRRYQRDLSVIMIDIDRFKDYNDAHGHPAGDEALREIAQGIARGARRGLDVVSRYGGEEFAIILPETDLAGARTVAENVRQAIEGNGKFLQRTTVSLGVASLAGEQMSAQELVERADRALYQAKCQGRNRTVIYEEWMQKAAHP
jgi:diguanylate cyclase (GGDEF)-like protein